VKEASLLPMNGNLLIVGDNEIKQGSVILRNMTTKEQVTIPIEHVVENIKAKLTI